VFNPVMFNPRPREEMVGAKRESVWQKRPAVFSVVTAKKERKLTCAKKPLLPMS
jgi:hypothetical protein